MSGRRGFIISGTRGNGFSLLEVLVALALLSIALVVILQLFSANLAGLSASDSYAKAVLKAESKMREVLDDEDIAEKSSSETTDDGYRIDTAITEAETQRTENLPVRLLEINLTIRWANGLKERVFTLKAMKTVPKKV